MTIDYAIHTNFLDPDNDSYRAVVQSTGSVELTDVISRMIERGSTITRADALAVLQEYYSAIESLTLDGYKVITPGAIYGVSIKGVFDSPSDSYDSSRHSVEASVNPGSQIRKTIKEKGQAQKVEATQPKPNPVEYTDINTRQRNDALTPGGMGHLTGHRLKFDINDLNQGVFLTRTDNGNTPIRIEIVGKNNPGELLFQVPATLTPGSYNLSVKALFGQEDVRTGLLGMPLNVEA